MFSVIVAEHIVRGVRGVQSDKCRLAFFRIDAPIEIVIVVLGGLDGVGRFFRRSASALGLMYRGVGYAAYTLYIGVALCLSLGLC